MSVKQISLYYKGDGSDKVYQIQIEESGSGYVVNFQYGARGGTLKSDTKTQSPVSLEQAEKIFGQLVKEKKNHRKTPYYEGEDGTPYVGTDKAERVSGYLPQLLNPIADLKHIINDNNWCVQEKYDGKRMLLRYADGKVTAINRSGLECGAPWSVLEDIAAIVRDSSGPRPYGEHVFDGECVGDIFFAFDVLVFDGNDIREEPYFDRWQRLNIIQGYKNVQVTEIVLRFKKRFVESLKAGGKEGAVFKRIDAPYKAGRPNSGGSQFKYKFVESATVRVQKINAKRSVLVAVEEIGAELIEVGNVTIPPNYEIPKVGDLVEVEYLYAYRGGSLYQPVYKGIRDDKTDADSSESLKYKAEAKAA
jgi:bifunctional non-homologous end joining protein LigD